MAKVEAHWSAQDEAGTPGLFRLVVFLTLRLPYWAQKPLIWIVCLVFAAWPGRTANAASRKFLAKILGREPSFREVHRHACEFAYVMLDRISVLARGAAGVRLEPQGQEVVSRCLEQGRGGIFLGAHFGSFEILRAFENELPGLRVRHLMYQAHARSSQEILRYLNPEVAERVISLSNGPQAMLAVFDRLTDGEFVAFLGDRLPEAAVGGGVRVDFLDGQIEVPKSPYVAAMAARAPIIMCFAPRLGDRRYAPRFSLLYDGAPVARSERDAACKEMAQRYAKTLEELCIQHPFNWLNFFDIWRGDGRLRGAAAGELREDASVAG